MPPREGTFSLRLPGAAPGRGRGRLWGGVCRSRSLSQVWVLKSQGQVLVRTPAALSAGLSPAGNGPPAPTLECFAEIVYPGRSTTSHPAALLLPCLSLS